LSLLDAFSPSSQMLEIGAQLNSMDQLERTIVAVLRRLGGFAPAAIEDRVGSGYTPPPASHPCCA
jgi:hypothetical protein